MTEPSQSAKTSSFSESALNCCAKSSRVWPAAQTGRGAIRVGQDHRRIGAANAANVAIIRCAASRFFSEAQGDGPSLPCAVQPNLQLGVELAGLRLALNPRGASPVDDDTIPNLAPLHRRGFF